VRESRQEHTKRLLGRRIAQDIDEDVGVARELHTSSALVEQVRQAARLFQCPHALDKAMSEGDLLECGDRSLG
jgi:hypothetical protein